MIFLILSIVLSSSLFLGFKFLSKLNVDLLPAICGNYIACICTGLLMNRGVPLNHIPSNILPASLGLGVLFFLVFYAMGYVSSHIGVGISSASSKLSLIIPVIYGSVLLNEPFSLTKLISILLVVPAVILMTYSKANRLRAKTIALPFFIFLGSGIIDTSLNILQKSQSGETNSLLSLLIFSGAFVVSIAFVLKQKYPIKALMKPMAYGLALGVPNFFSIYFLLKALGNSNLNSSDFYLINNTGTMLLSYGLAFVFFSEKVTNRTLLGITLALVSIYLIVYF